MQIVVCHDWRNHLPLYGRRNIAACGTLSRTLLAHLLGSVVNVAVIGACQRQPYYTVGLHKRQIGFLETAKMVHHLFRIARLVSRTGSIVEINLETIDHCFVVKPLRIGKLRHPHRRTGRQIVQFIRGKVFVVCCLLLCAGTKD